MTLIRAAFFSFVLAGLARAEDKLVLGMEPGCFTGPVRSVLTAESGNGAWIQYANDEREWGPRHLLKDRKTVDAAFAALRKIAFTEEDQELLNQLTLGVIGPGRYSLKVELDGSTWAIKYLSDSLIPEMMESLHGQDERFAGQEKEIRAVLAKVRTVHSAVAALLPKNEAQVEDPNRDGAPHE